VNLDRLSNRKRSNIVDAVTLRGKRMSTAPTWRMIVAEGEERSMD
jgi:hypothetical protein